MQPIVLPRAEHPISRKLIDPDALKVMYRLINNGYRAYLVGGAVRDLMLGRNPKDFDIGTDAHPNQVKRLFRNCRLVGRRFRLAHVHFGDKIIEVSTFRRRAELEELEEDADRLIRSDNTFGTPEEDAVRRDFNLNGLFYDLETFSVIDYVGGIEDLHNRVIRSIGDPDVRLAEDPVRIQRAIKFAARLDFRIDDELWAAICRRVEDIHKCSTARVLEETYRLLRGGAAARSFQLLEESGLLHELLPEVATHLARKREERRDGDRVFWQYLDALDEFKQEGAEMSNPLLLGALAVHLLGMAIGDSDLEEGSPPDLTKRIDTLTRDWVARLGVARRDRERLAHMLRSQPRFTKPRGRRFRPRAFVTKHYYPDAEALFALGCRATGQGLETLEKWRAISGETPSDPPPQGNGRRRGRGRIEATEPVEAGAGVVASEENGDGEKPRRSRRGRRGRRRRSRSKASAGE